MKRPVEVHIDELAIDAGATLDAAELRRALERQLRGALSPHDLRAVSDQIAARLHEQLPRRGGRDV